MLRALRGLLVTAVLAVMLSGCGATDVVDAQDVSAAAVKTTDAGSSRVELVSEDDESRTTMAGVIDYERRLAVFSFLERTKQNEQAVVPAVEMRFVGTTAFFESKLLGGSGSGLGEAEPKPWLALDWSEVEVSLETLIFPFPFIDPSRLLAALEEASGEVEDLGELEIRGVATDGYRLTIDLRRLVEEAPQSARTALLKELDSRKQKTLPVEVWLDDEGLARRLTLPEGDEPVTMDFFDFGVDVDVQVPPDDQVESFDGLFGVVESEGSISGTMEERETEPYEEDE